MLIPTWLVHGREEYVIRAFKITGDVFSVLDARTCFLAARCAAFSPTPKPTSLTSHGARGGLLGARGLAWHLVPGPPPGGGLAGAH